MRERGECDIKREINMQIPERGDCLSLLREIVLKRERASFKLGDLNLQRRNVVL
jgi:hypothetical protein